MQLEAKTKLLFVRDACQSGLSETRRVLIMYQGQTRDTRQRMTSERTVGPTEDWFAANVFVELSFDGWKGFN